MWPCTQGMKLPTRRYAVGEFLIKQGQRANDEVFLIKSGKVDIMIAGDSGESIKAGAHTLPLFSST